VAKTGPPPPEFLELRLPELEFGMRDLPALVGTYKLDPVTKNTMWHQSNGTNVLRDIDGHWHIGDPRAEIGRLRSRDSHTGPTSKRWPTDPSLWWDYYHREDRQWKGIVLRVFHIMSPMDKARVRHQAQVVVKAILEEDWMEQPECVRRLLDKESDLPGDEYALVPERVVAELVELRMQAAGSLLGGFFDAADVHQRGELDGQCLREAFDAWADLGSDAHSSLVAGSCTALIASVLEQVRQRTSGRLINPEQRRTRNRRCWVELQMRCKNDFANLEDPEEGHAAVQKIWTELTQAKGTWPATGGVTRKRFLDCFLLSITQAASMVDPLQDLCRSLIGSELGGSHARTKRRGRSASTLSKNSSSGDDLIFEKSKRGRRISTESSEGDMGGSARRLDGRDRASSTASDDDVKKKRYRSYSTASDDKPGRRRQRGRSVASDSSDDLPSGSRTPVRSPDGGAGIERGSTPPPQGKRSSGRRAGSGKEPNYTQLRGSKGGISSN